MLEGSNVAGQAVSGNETRQLEPAEYGARVARSEAARLPDRFDALAVLDQVEHQA